MNVKLRVSHSTWDDVWSRMEKAYKDAGADNIAWAKDDQGGINLNGIRLVKDVAEVNPVQFPSFLTLNSNTVGMYDTKTDGFIGYHSPSGEYVWTANYLEFDGHYIEDSRPATVEEKRLIDEIKRLRADLAASEDEIKEVQDAEAEAIEKAKVRPNY